jgi:hypothetical protein
MTRIRIFSGGRFIATITADPSKFLALAPGTILYYDDTYFLVSESRRRIRLQCDDVRTRGPEGRSLYGIAIENEIAAAEVLNRGHHDAAL